MSNTMRAVVKKSIAPGISVEQVPIPKPGPGQALVKVRAAGICGSDIHMYEGAPSYKVFEKFMPLVMGHEFAGDVVELGDGVAGLDTGDRVVVRPAVPCDRCRYCRNGKPHFCEEAFTRLLGLQVDGGFAEYAAVPASACIPLSPSVNYELAALLEPMGVAANAVYDSGLEIGETVVVQGPGPIGLLTLLFAKARGAGQTIVIGTSKDAARLDVARAFGADSVVVADQSDAREAVLAATGGCGADVVFEVSGVPALVQTALDMCDKTGRAVVVGIYGAAGKIDFTPMVRTAKRLIGTYGGPIAWERLLAWLEAESPYARMPGKLVTHRSSLEDANAAFERGVKKENIKELFIMG